MHLNLNSQKLFIYFLIYVVLKSKYYIFEIEKLNYEKGTNLNYIEENDFQKEILNISIDF